MLGVVAGGGFPDITSKTPSGYAAGIDSSTYVNLVNISGSGFLISGSAQRAGATALTMYFEITIDGVYKGTVPVIGGVSSGSPSFLLLLRFNTSLLVRCKASAGGICYYNANVSLD